MFQPLPGSYEEALPILQRMNFENSNTTLLLAGSRRRPDPPRSLISQGASLEGLITWNAPQKFADITGWRIYRDNENNLIDTLLDPSARQYRPKLPAAKTTAFYVSSINALQIESIKVQTFVTANSDQFVVSGTGGGTGGSAASTPPGYDNEPTGGLQQVGRTR